MAVNHIESDVRLVTDHSLGFVSSAEGFIFLSGLIAGQTYTRRHEAQGLVSVWQSCRRRAVEIYIWHAATVLFTVAWCQILIHAGRTELSRLPPLFATDPLQGVWAGLSLVYQPGLLDILPNYVGFMLLAPLVLHLCKMGKFWWVWAGSALVWLFDQLLFSAQPYVHGVINTGAFHFLSWQWLFVTGLLLGNVRYRQSRLMRRPRLVTVALATSAAVFLWIIHHPRLPNWWGPEEIAALTNKTSLAPLRAINFAVIAFLIALTATARPRWFDIRVLSYLGKHSLSAFGAHVLATMIILAWPESFETAHGRWLDTAAVIGSLFVGAWAGQFAQSRTSSAFAASPPTAQL